jgi:DNA polymerase/3'-5' exonuclease PolX
MGCLYSPVKFGTRRRVDIKLYPYRERIFATVYFTGNGYFNRSMRLWAARRFNFRLNDHGLFSLADDRKRVLDASTEMEVFDFLKLVYKEPHERDCWDALEPIEGALEPDLHMTEAEFKEETKYVWVD